jgi:hypothetical protein
MKVSPMKYMPAGHRQGASVPNGQAKPGTSGPTANPTAQITSVIKASGIKGSAAGC